MWPFKKKRKKPPFECPHKGAMARSLCAKYGCPDDPDWCGDGCR